MKKVFLPIIIALFGMTIVTNAQVEVLPPDPGTVDGAITCQEARELALALALAQGSQSSTEYVVVGYVTSLNDCSINDR